MLSNVRNLKLNKKRLATPAIVPFCDNPNPLLGQLYNLEIWRNPEASGLADVFRNETIAKTVDKL